MHLIISGRFRRAVPSDGLRFVELETEPGFYALIAENQVAFDAARRRTTLERKCDECQRYFVIAGAYPVFLASAVPLPDVISRTDLEFGTGDEQHPLTLLGCRLAAEVRKANLTGLELKAILDAPSVGIPV